MNGLFGGFDLHSDDHAIPSRGFVTCSQSRFDDEMHCKPPDAAVVGAALRSLGDTVKAGKDLKDFLHVNRAARSACVIMTHAPS